MAKFFRTLLLSFVVISLVASSGAQDCSRYVFANRNTFRSCSNLPVLNAFLHWNYHQSNGTVDIAYRHTGVSTTQWVAWALNPARQGMTNAQSLVAYRNSSGLVRAYTSPLGDYGTTTLAEGALSFNVPSLRAVYANNEIIIFATLQLPGGRTSFNQVWQVGSVSGDSLLPHSTANENKAAQGTVDFLTGSVASGGIVGQRKRNVHGVLNAVSWGILMPTGVIIARYMRVFKSADPAWFYLHVACQSSAYIVGVAGWGTGMKLGSDSPGVQQTTHRNIGITLFCLGTLQVFALLLRPKKDHKYRVFWNAYHHSIGYSAISLSIVNVFQGFKLLDPAKGWKRAYIGILIFLGAVALILEVFTWIVIIKRKRDEKEKGHANGTNGAANAYCGRSQQDV